MDLNGIVWQVRAESNGAAEAINFRKAVCSIGWHEVRPDLLANRTALEAYGAKHWDPDSAAQVWAFVHDPTFEGAVIILPRLAKGHEHEVAVGVCIGPAYWASRAAGTDADPRLRRAVRWLVTAEPRTTFSESARSWFAHAQHTVRRVRSDEVAQELLTFARARLP